MPSFSQQSSPLTGTTLANTRAPRAGKSFSKLRAFVAVFVVMALIAATACAGWATYLQLSGNVHAIAPGIAYRSNTLSAQQLQQVVADNGIKTIINLRGGARDETWYAAESALAKRLDIGLIDLPMSDKAAPDAKTLAALLAALHSAPRPILIHCKAGADRTGLAAALFQYEEMGVPASDAANQLSLRYGHFPWLGSLTSAMDQTFQDFVSTHENQVKP